MAVLLTSLGISIHAPREGGDSQFFGLLWAIIDFNPRPPRGGRPGYQYEDLKLTVISIHAPREGGDRKKQAGGQR